MLKLTLVCTSLHCLSATSRSDSLNCFYRPNFFVHILVLSVRELKCLVQATRIVIAGQLHTLLHFHLGLSTIVFIGHITYAANLISKGASLRCLQRLSRPCLAACCPLAKQQVHQRYVQPGPLVLKSALLQISPVIDRDRTVSRRSEPSSRTALMGEQPNPWNRLQPQDAMSRHRGAKPPRRCGLLGEISLLSPG